MPPAWIVDALAGTDERYFCGPPDLLDGSVLAKKLMVRERESAEICLSTVCQDTVAVTEERRFCCPPDPRRAFGAAAAIWGTSQVRTN